MGPVIWRKGRIIVQAASNLPKILGHNNWICSLRYLGVKFVPVKYFRVLLFWFRFSESPSWFQKGIFQINL